MRNRIATATKENILLPTDAIKEIERIIAAGGNAKVSTGKGGITVYEEKVKKTYSQS